MWCPYKREAPCVHRCAHFLFYFILVLFFYYSNAALNNGEVNSGCGGGVIRIKSCFFVGVCPWIGLAGVQCRIRTSSQCGTDLYICVAF